MRSSSLRIGEVAARSGVSVDTVRFYERRKLLPPAPRTEGGFRLFPPEVVEQVRFIKQAQELGFSLDELSELLTTKGGAAECRQMRDLLMTKLNDLDKRIETMRSFRRKLTRHLAACESELNERGEAARCPVIVNITRSGRAKR